VDRSCASRCFSRDGQGVIALAPAEGILHPTNVLDTLGRRRARGTMQDTNDRGGGAQAGALP